MNYVIYDAETKRPCDEVGWDNYTDMGIQCIVTYDYHRQRWDLWQDQDKLTFIDRYWLQPNVRMVGFNTYNFDIPLIEACWAQSNSDNICKDLFQCKHFDIRNEYLEKTAEKKGILDTFARLNHYTNLEYLPSNIYGHCLEDVRITKFLFDKILAEGQLNTPAGIIHFNVRYL